jgi:Uma2 family endonuclease
MGTEDHSDVSIRLLVALVRTQAGGEYKVGNQISIRHGDEVRIPDAAVYRRGARLYRGILDEPPMLCVEIVSPSQSPSELFAKCETYDAWGVPYCWVVDPVKQAAWEYHATMPLDRVSQTLHAGFIEVPLDEIFSPG